MKKQKGDRVYLVYMQTSLHDWRIVRVFKEEPDADKFCKDQNEINMPEFDEWGYCEGIYHSYESMKVE